MTTNDKFQKFKKFLIKRNLRFKDSEENQRFTLKFGNLILSVYIEEGYYKIYGRDVISRDFEELYKFLENGATLNSKIIEKYNSQNWFMRLITKPFYRGIFK